jgi:hypothetical protein
VRTSRALRAVNPMDGDLRFDLRVTAALFSTSDLLKAREGRCQRIGLARSLATSGGFRRKAPANPSRALHEGQRTVSSSVRPRATPKSAPQGRHFQRTAPACASTAAVTPGLRRRVGRRSVVINCSACTRKVDFSYRNPRPSRSVSATALAVVQEVDAAPIVSRPDFATGNDLGPKCFQVRDLGRGALAQLFGGGGDEEQQQAHVR